MPPNRISSTTPPTSSTSTTPFSTIPSTQPHLTRRRSRSLSDPLSLALLPPLNEAPADRERRLRLEQQAKKVSDDIDEQIRNERAELRRKKQEIKILLLGQSESGKSTTLKQFQLLHTPNAFHAERIAWRSVIYLNLIRSIRRILEALLPIPDPSSSISLPADYSSQPLQYQHHPNNASSSSSSSSPYDVYSNINTNTNINTNGTWARSSTRKPISPKSSMYYGSASTSTTPYQYPHPNSNNSNINPNRSTSPDTINKSLTKFEKYAQKLNPLIILEERLIRQLSFPDEDNDEDDDNYGNNSNNASSSARSVKHAYEPPLTSPISLSPSHSPHTHHSHIHAHGHGHKEPSVRPTSTWKTSLSFTGRSISVRAPKSAHTGEIQGWWEDPDDPVHVINALAAGDYGMISLWRDEDVKSVLARRRVRMEESSGFYLDDISRITAMRYIPNNDDVLKARLKTLGVVEHTFTIKGSDRGVEWKIYDVGGARHQRQAWAPYFEDVNAIIFLAPISAFDQVLNEDPSVNRLEDSLLLWKEVIQNKLLGNINIILFLNKIDLLKKKLEAGVMLCHHMISYGSRGNDFESVCKYFRNKFGALHQSFSPNKERELYIHLTSVTDTRKTSTIISNVRDIILRGNLKGSRLI